MIPMSGAKAFPVTENVWCVRRASYLTCSYIVRTPLGVVLVDAGMDSTGNDIFTGLKAMKLQPADIRSVLLTHWHNDHAAGARAIQDSAKVNVYCHANDTPQLTRQTARLGLRGKLSELVPERGIFVLFKGLLGEAVPNAVVDPINVKDCDLLEEFFEVVETPGHTPGHISFYYRPDKVLFAGDALAVVHGRIRFMARPVTLDLEQARASMQRCLTLDFERLCPGHRSPITSDVPRLANEMLEYVESGGRWPLLG